MKKSRYRGAAVVFTLSFLVAACGGPAEEEATDAGTDETEEAGAEEDDAPEPASDSAIAALDEALEDRELVAQALESAMATDNASAVWDGDVLTIALDGDVDEDIKSFQHCRTVGHFLEEGDTLILEFPNGSIDCADIEELEGELIW